MSDRLPPLTALRAFEAAARHLSFARAADELNVTPAALSFQIKSLEEHFGAPLFRRLNRAVELTDRGRELSRRIKPAFRTIQSAWDAAHAPVDTRPVRITGPAKAVHSWVMPALANAQATESRPDVRISWDLSKQNRDVARGEVDMAIRWALKPNDDLHWEPLLRTWFTPLIRPDIARFVQRPADLEKQGLINVEFVLDAGMKESAWESWYRINGLETPTNFAVTCADTASAVDTAVTIGHAAIGGSFLASDQLIKGELVAPFDTAIAPFSRFWLVCRKGGEATEEFQWILKAARQGAEKIDEQAKGMEVVHPDGSSAQLR